MIGIIGKKTSPNGGVFLLQRAAIQTKREQKNNKI